MITPPVPIAPETRLAVELEAQQWNALLAILQDAPAPYRITKPLFESIGEQLQAGAASVGAPAAQLQNGGPNVSPP